MRMKMFAGTATIFFAVSIAGASAMEEVSLEIEPTDHAVTGSCEVKAESGSSTVTIESGAGEQRFSGKSMSCELNNNGAEEATIGIERYRLGMRRPSTCSVSSADGNSSIQMSTCPVTLGPGQTISIKN